MQLHLHHFQAILAYECEVSLAVDTRPCKTNPLFFLLEHVYSTKTVSGKYLVKMSSGSNRDHYGLVYVFPPTLDCLVHHHYSFCDQ